MPIAVNLITLGVSDLQVSRRFYEKVFGWSPSKASQENVVFFQTPGIVVSLYPRHLLAEDVQTKPDGSGFRGITLAHNVGTKAEATQLIALAEQAGGKVVKKAQDVFWGGFSGYFADPDGHLWEVAWNPHFEIDERGLLKMP